MPNPINKALEEFREKFLMKDSECTWEGYPLPEQIEDFWISKLQQVRRETLDEVEKDMRTMIAWNQQNRAYSKKASEKIRFNENIQVLSDVIDKCVATKDTRDHVSTVKESRELIKQGKTQTWQEFDDTKDVV